MSEWERDRTAWARVHRVCFDVEPLLVVVHDRRVHVGFTITLYARLSSSGPSVERWVETAEVRAELRRVLRSLGPTGGGLEVQSVRGPAFWAPEVGALAEIVVSARVFDADLLSAARRRLEEMGLKERRRPRRMTAPTERHHE